MSDDPRLGLPSGSSALQDQLCPGRWRAQKEFDALTGGQIEEEQEPEKNGEDMDHDAEAGKRIHKIYAGEVCEAATERERERARQALQVDTEMHEKWAANFNGLPFAPITALREHRWWLHNENGEPLYSGQTDLVKFRGKVGEEVDILVADLKGLWGHHDDALLNQQLRRYIALIDANIQGMGYTVLRSAAAYLNQPAVTMRPQLALYEREDIDTAVMQMHLDIAAMMDPEAPRVAGPVQCHHCRAKLVCEEFIQERQELPLALPVEMSVDPPRKEVLAAALNKLPGEKLAQIIPWLPTFEHLVALAKSETKRRLRQDPLSVPGFRLKKNSPRSKVVDLLKVWDRLTSAYALTAEEFLALCSITKQNCEDVIREKSGLKGKGLDEKVKIILDGATMAIPVSDSIEEGEPQ